MTCFNTYQNQTAFAMKSNNLSYKRACCLFCYDFYNFCEHFWVHAVIVPASVVNLITLAAGLDMGVLVITEGQVAGLESKGSNSKKQRFEKKTGQS